MRRDTGTFRVTTFGGEEVRAFIPHALPPVDPALELTQSLQDRHAEATAALGKLEIAAGMVPDAAWFLYGFVRKEALITSQIEGTQATLQDVLTFDAGGVAERPDDVQEVCNYVYALNYARREIARPKGLPLATRLLCEAHKRLMAGARGGNKSPGELRRTQNWIGGTRPGNAHYVPPPPEAVAGALSDLEKWIHAPSELSPLIRVGLAHAQFETIHPFLDGNGRIGRLLIALLVEHWGLLTSPLLYISVAFKRHRSEYYDRLTAIRTEGDWEAWIQFFLECVIESADDGLKAARKLFAVTSADREKLAAHRSATVPAIRLFDQLPAHPMITLRLAIDLLGVSKPTAIKAITSLRSVGILSETTGKQRDRVYAYQAYLKVLTADTQ